MVFEKVQRIIAEQLEIFEDEIEPETRLDELQIDEIDFYYDIIPAIEFEFDILITSTQFEKFKTVQDLVDYIEDNI